MNTVFRPRGAVLFLGDIFFFAAALWLSLFLRTFESPSQALLITHLAPFSFLFIAWVAVFFITGLYENRSLILARRALSATLLTAQTVNVIIAALFFFFIPSFGIAPKTLLFIYAVVSFLLVLLWRVVLYPRLHVQKPESALVVGDGAEIDELVHAIRSAHRAPVYIVATIAPSGDSIAQNIEAAIEENDIQFVIADFSNARTAGAFPRLYNFLSRGVRFLDAMALYEEMFGRVPLSTVDNRWLARNVSRYSHTLYDPLKRSMDIMIGFVAGIVSLILYPFIALAIKLEDGGPVFIAQERVGEDNLLARLYKFRSMRRNETNLLVRQRDNTITRVGQILRATRLDELPQLWNIVRGDLSLIGPRPELPSGVALYEKEIPYYNVRHLIKPGLSGWAQLYHDNHPHHGAEVGATREKLSYDLYYLKHRSLWLDLVVALKTIKKLLTRSGI